MGRKSRAKRQRVQAPRAASSEPVRGVAGVYAGARVARVAVDDETWAAFRELCGATPASVRLGELVSAEVERMNRDRAEAPSALAALRAIHDHAAVLETFVRQSQSETR